MFLIGLTGGIAAGKSTVAKLWQDLGAIEIDADQLAKETLAKGSAGLAEVVATFGAEILTSEGELNRQKLSEIVFGDSQARQKLESIVHPLVREAAQQLLKAVPDDAIVVYTVPLLVEAKVDLPFDVVVTVEAPEEVRVERLISTRGMTADQAQARIDAQAKPVERAAKADYILNSNQNLDLLLNDARALWKVFQKRATN